MSERLIDISEITVAQDTAGELESIRREQREKERQLTSSVRERIDAGETTGNRLLDLVIVRTGRVDQELLDLYTDLQLLVQDSVGEPVFVIAREEKQTSHSITALPEGELHSGTILEHAGMGTIKREALEVDIQSGRWAFPTDEAWVHIEATGYRNQPTLLSQNLSTSVKESHFSHNPYEGYLDTPMSLQLKHPASLSRTKPPVYLEVAVGHEEIDKFFRLKDEEMRFRNPYRDVFNGLAERLGVPQVAELERS